MNRIPTTIRLEAREVAWRTMMLFDLFLFTVYEVLTICAPLREIDQEFLLTYTVMFVLGSPWFAFLQFQGDIRRYEKSLERRP